MQADITETDNVERFRAIFTDFKRIELRIARANFEKRLISSDTKKQLNRVLEDFNGLVKQYPSVHGNEEALLSYLREFRNAARGRANSSLMSQTKNPHGLRSFFLASMRRIQGRRRRPLVPDVRASNIHDQPNFY